MTRNKTVNRISSTIPKLILLVLVLLVVDGNSQNGNLSYKNKKSFKQQKGFKKHNYDPVKVTFVYPHFSGNNSKFLNSEIAKYLLEKSATFENYCSEFFSDYRKYGEATFYSWEVEKTVKVEYLSNKIVTLSRFHVEKRGDNAFLGTSSPLTYDLKSKKILTLNSVFKGNYQPELTKLVWRKLKQDSKTNGLEGRFYEDAVDKYLSKTYYFTATGIVFSFDWGEIAPRISPGCEAEVPYKLMKKYLKSGTPVWDLAK